MNKLHIIILLISFTLFSLITTAQSDKTHTVKRGETFASVAQRYGITEQEIKGANPDEDVCYVGLKLIIPTPGSTSTWSSQKKLRKVTVISDKYYISEDFEHFGDSLEMEADRGNLMAIKELGDCYHWGVDGKEKSLTKALELYNKAAEAGYPFAEWEIAQMYGAGSGVKKDKVKSQEWYDKAFDEFTNYADKGNAKAMTRLGDYHVSSAIPGNLERIDINEGIYWYREAVNNGDHTAAIDLATIYRKGFGVDKDEEEALKWDARFCIDVEKKGLFAEDYSSYSQLKKAGYSKENWENVAKDTYKDNIKPIKLTPNYVLESTGGGTSPTAASATTDNMNVSSSSSSAPNNGGSNGRIYATEWFELCQTTCPKCGGSGCITCPTCGGSGKEQCISRVYTYGFGLNAVGVQHPINCSWCSNTGWINCRKCYGKGTEPCKICGGQKSLRKLNITKDIPCVHPRPAAGTFPTGTTLTYMTVQTFFRGNRGIYNIFFRNDGLVVINIYTVCSLVDNGDSWLLVPQTNYSNIQRLLSKDFKYYLENNGLCCITSGEQLANQQKINQQATAFAEMYSNTYIGSGTQKESEIGKQIKEDIAEIETRQATRARQEQSNNQLNVTLTQTHREVYCNKCKSWGLAHTHYK